MRATVEKIMTDPVHEIIVRLSGDKDAKMIPFSLNACSRHAGAAINMFGLLGFKFSIEIRKSVPACAMCHNEEIRKAKLAPLVVFVPRGGGES